MGFSDALSHWSNTGMRAVEKLARRQEDRGGPQPGSAGSTSRKGRKNGGLQLYQQACCELALEPVSPRACWDKCQEKDGYTMRAWGCCDGGGFYTCQECTSEGSCWDGDFACSSYESVPGGCA